MKKQIIAEDAYQAPSLLSQALEVGKFIFTSGFIHVDKDGKLVGETTQEKVEAIFGHIQKVLEAAGVGLNNIIKVNIYVTDMTVMKDFNETYIKYFEKPYPVREAVCVKELPLGAEIEVSVVAKGNCECCVEEYVAIHCKCQAEDCDCEHGHCHCEFEDCECVHVHCECVEDKCECDHEHGNHDSDCGCKHKHCHCDGEDCDCEHAHCKCVEEKCECDHKH